MDLKSRIFIAGGTGMVGCAIIRRLASSGYKNLLSNYYKKKPITNHESRITYVSLDLTRQEDTERFFEKERPDYVFLAAAKVGGILANDTYKAEFIYDNIMIAANVIHFAYKYGVRKLLNLGSSCIYPKFAPQPMKEEYLLTGLLEPTNEPYAVAKIAAIKLCRYYDEQYGTNFISVMPTNLFGVGDNFNLETSHVLPALIRKMYLGKCLQNGDLEAIRKDLGKYPLKGSDVSRMKDTDIIAILSVYGIKTDHPSPITRHASENTSRFTPHTLRSTVVELWGSGKHFREFLYVDDVADACVFLMENYDAARFMSDKSKVADNFMNIGTGEDLTIKDLANMVKEIVGFEGEIVWDSSKPEGTPRKLLDVSKIKSLGWQPRISLEEGIRKTYEWYVSGRKS
jgi:GDP-L-fucose synthase